MIKLIDLRVNPLTNKDHKEFICDTDADFADLPKGNPGDCAVSAATCNVYVVNASGYWVPLGGGIVGGSLEGDGQEFHQLAPAALTFRSTEPLEEFKEVQVNGETVDPENYTLEEGSTIVKFKTDFLKTLGNGKHKVAIVSENNTVSGNFDVKVPELNEHGFYYNQPYTAYVEMFGGKKAFFLREGGTLYVIDAASGVVETGTFTCNGKNASMTISIGTLTGTWSDDGKSIYCNELQVTASLGDTQIVSDEDYIYVYNEDLGGYEVKAIDKTKSEYGAIKTGINGVDTVALHAWAFENCTSLKSIKIPASVISVGEYAFSQCSSLKSIVFEEGSRLTTISQAAFVGCPIKNIDLPDSVTSIGGGAFSNTALVNIKIPVNMTAIDWIAFADCTALDSIEIPAGITSIGSQALSGCISLNNIVFEGTTTQWNAIAKSDNWNLEVPATHVQCSDGTVPLN